MAYLHSDREQFRDAIDLAYEQTSVMVQAIEKDYYVTMLLRLLAQKMPYIVFKGGTSLSKCHKVIRRFSEDISSLTNHSRILFNCRFRILLNASSRSLGTSMSFGSRYLKPAMFFSSERNSSVSIA